MSERRTKGISVPGNPPIIECIASKLLSVTDDSLPVRERRKWVAEAAREAQRIHERQIERLEKVKNAYREFFAATREFEWSMESADPDHEDGATRYDKQSLERMHAARKALRDLGEVDSFGVVKEADEERDDDESA